MPWPPLFVQHPHCHTCLLVILDLRRAFICFMPHATTARRRPVCGLCAAVQRSLPHRPAPVSLPAFTLPSHLHDQLSKSALKPSQCTAVFCRRPASRPRCWHAAAAASWAVRACLGRMRTLPRQMAEREPALTHAGVLGAHAAWKLRARLIAAAPGPPPTLPQAPRLQQVRFFTRSSTRVLGLVHQPRSHRSCFPRFAGGAPALNPACKCPARGLGRQTGGMGGGPNTLPTPI